jgi:hypothetical protein
MPLRLSSTDYQNLVEVAHSAHDSRQMHRAQALLWLHEGDTVDEVATRLFVTTRVRHWRCPLGLLMGHAAGVPKRCTASSIP